MDWEKVTVPDFRNTKLQATGVGELDYAKIMVITRLVKKSQSQVVQTAVDTYLERTWEQHEDRLQIEANKRGIPIEECFIELLNEALG
jgi:hypothetical protein